MEKTKMFMATSSNSGTPLITICINYRQNSLLLKYQHGFVLYEGLHMNPTMPLNEPQQHKPCA